MRRGGRSQVPRTAPGDVGSLSMYVRMYVRRCAATPPVAACTADRPPAGRARAAARGGGRCPALPAGRAGRAPGSRVAPRYKPSAPQCPGRCGLAVYVCTAKCRPLPPPLPPARQTLACRQAARGRPRRRTSPCRQGARPGAAVSARGFSIRCKKRDSIGSQPRAVAWMLRGEGGRAGSKK